MKRFLGLVILATILGLCSQAAANTFRCGTKVVQVGDSEVTLTKACGQPVKRVKIEGGHSVVKGSRSGKHKVVGYENYQAGEKWYYDRGPVDFIYIITVVNGSIKSIETGERAR